MDLTQANTIGDESLYEFLVNGPKKFKDNECIKKYQLKNGDYIHCVLSNYNFYITGTDIANILVWSSRMLG